MEERRTRDTAKARIRRRRTRGLELAVLALALWAWAFAPTAAAAITSVVEDPIGDAATPAGRPITGETYQDIVRAEVSKDESVFTFTMVFAAPVPATPELPTGIALQAWLWGLDMNPATSPVGFPFAPGVGAGAAPPEFIVFVSWDGASFTGIVIDRRPLLTGEAAVITSVSPNINGAKVSVSVNAALLGDPSSFTWIGRTSDWSGPLGTRTNHEIDRAPDTTRARWPP